ncbi:hypothetical protein [Pajaroellobacter abortibovis]|nr:hypothetical protein [Pajaroellobacter abortibovis]
MIELPRRLLPSSRRFLLDPYVKRELSARQIAGGTVSSKSTVLNALRYFGIPIREPPHPYGQNSFPSFWLRKDPWKIRVYPKEQNIIAVIEQLHAEGMSLKDITGLLTKMKIHTAHNGYIAYPPVANGIPLLRGIGKLSPCLTFLQNGQTQCNSHLNNAVNVFNGSWIRTAFFFQIERSC